MKYRKLKGYKYELLDTVAVDTGITGCDINTEHISLWEEGRLFVKAHYAWDGASGPTIDDKTNMRSSLIHDCCYQLMREGHLGRSHRKQVDILFRDICIEDGMSKFRAWYYYIAVRHFSKKYSLPRKNPRGKVFEI